MKYATPGYSTVVSEGNATASEVGVRRVSDMMTPEGRIFLKSEWGQISNDWPCLSFSKSSVGERLRRDFKPGRDILVYVGTTNAESTPDPAHRSCLISAIVIEPNQILMTRKIVPDEVWQQSVADFGNRWPHAMPVIEAAQFLGPPYPSARDIMPNAYRSFSEIANRGGVVEAAAAERAAIMRLPVRPIQLHLAADVASYVGRRDATNVDKAVAEEIYRIACLIQARSRASGDMSSRINPQRAGGNISELIVMIKHKWLVEQQGNCALCGGPLRANQTNGMLQPSLDRLDSSNGAYISNNTQMTHLACNLAKNKWGREEFIEWLNVACEMRHV